MVIRVAFGILLFVFIHTSVVMECVSSSSFPSQHQPLCLLFFLLNLATNFASRNGGWVLLLSPNIWVRRIQFSVVERVGISCCFSSPSKPDQFITIGCGVEILSPQIFSFPLPAFLKKGGMVRAVSPWYLVAWNTSFIARSTFQAYDLCFLSLFQLSCRFSSCCMLRPRGLCGDLPSLWSPGQRAKGWNRGIH